jgi:putative MFS transporter
VSTVVAVHPAGERDRLLAPRDDALVRETVEGDGVFGCAEGPFDRYRRTVRALDDGSVEVTADFSVRPTFWGLLFVPGMRRSLVRPPGPTPWWAPPDRLDLRGAEVLGLLCTISVVGGYLGTVITQTATFAADEFGASTGAQADLLSAVRASILITLVLTVLADRIGRRRLITGAALAGCLLTATSAVSPNLFALAATQTLARGFAGALLLLIAIVSAEEMPAGSRAYAYSVLSMCQALGAGMCLWALPLADIGGDGSSSWRALYVLPLLYLPLVVVVHRHLPESRRFARQHVEAPLAGHGRRFWLLAITLFLLAVYATPASQLGNDFLKEARGFSGARISLFVLVTATPAAIGIVVGGHLADVRGRRMVGAVGVAGGTILSVIAFSASGWPLWAWTLAQNIVAAAVVPALGVYRPELFPTSLRGKAAGAIECFSLAGAVVGLQLIGGLVDGGWTYGSAFAVVAAAPLLVAVLIITAYPETAHLSLEDINPEDRASPPVRAASGPSARRRPPRPPGGRGPSTRGRRPPPRRR